MAIRSPSSFHTDIEHRKLISDTVLKESTVDKIFDNQHYGLHAKQIFVSDCHPAEERSSASYSTFPHYYFGDVKDMCGADSVTSDILTMNVSVLAANDGSGNAGHVRVRSYNNSGGSYDTGVMPLIDTVVFDVTGSATPFWQDFETLDLKTNGIENVIFVDYEMHLSSNIKYGGIMIYG